MNAITEPALPLPHHRPRDWGFALLVLLATAAALLRHGAQMDGYDRAVLLGTAPALVWLGWHWRPLQGFMLGVAVLAGLAVTLYQQDGTGQIERAQTVLLLKYALSSQSAILWMCLLFVMSTVFYWIGLLGSAPKRHDGSTGTGTPPAMMQIGAELAWLASVLALTGTLVRWYESHLLGPGLGYIPVSNLYEVFILFCWTTTLFSLYYESRYQSRSLGAFTLLIVSAAVGFLLWYSLARDAHVIQPLIPALQSWWMKIHVPANFIGYGTFAIAAMVAFAWLLKHHAHEGRWWKLAPLWLLGMALCLEPVAFRRSVASEGAAFWMLYWGVAALAVAAIVALRRPLAQRLPSFEVLDDVMYKAIAVGFAFFTIATVLGALWAAEAWGGYWSWDPKETWALIVWLNYAAWLHLRLLKGLRGAVAAWWALIGLAITTFAFLGVNLYLSGLHSYGTL
ncbi:cytochrome c-type biogenesis protein CcsB [Lampropedia hyalina DSM 16112]|jgi:cytochrome c-type biogenesis protein CcsB|uniref:Cytochrome c-type biogenesis protein CcsB n=1 Tax=Lampropedia hyalina DSM 16112 TaxID=1122156 RepID=A0A1M4YJW1_9BURK|nr:cytochrome c-type biogenesis protein CcsB [Lampropedia hyalina DSM 16112]